MIIYPAIDIKSGNCVRLFQGDYAKEKIYSNSPLSMAQQFLEQGAEWLHLVDLDGAKDPRQNQAELIKDLLSSVPLKIQIGGGIRTLTQIDEYFSAGASRVVIGSLAVHEPKLIERWLKIYDPKKIVLAFDLKFVNNKPQLMAEGWQKFSKVDFFSLLEHFLDAGVEHILSTDIERDGTLSGPNKDLYLSILAKFPKVELQASGGVRSLAEIRELKEIKVAGAIIGKALYEANFELAKALSC